MPDVLEYWKSSRLDAAFYDWAIEHESVGRVMGQLVWGTDTARFYREIERLGQEPPGSAILDIPCGGGVAFRGLRPGQDVRYVAADISPVMMERARDEARRRGLEQVEVVEGDVSALQFADGQFDLCVTYTGLHCFPDPNAAIAELARVTRPGGELRGTAVVKQAGRRYDAVVRMMQRRGSFGPCLTLAELEASLAAAGMVGIESDSDGALAYFSAKRGGDG